MKKILLPTDFSENAYNAIRYSVQLFQNEKCTFYLLNCYTPVFYNSDFIQYRPSPTLSMKDVHKKHSKKELEKIKLQVNKTFSNSLHQFKLISSFSTLQEEISRQVRKNKIELIIMGTQGATGAAQILFGTNTVHAIKKTSCPLLAIPSGSQFKPLKMILFPTDYQINYKEDQLKLLKELAEEHHSTLNIIHISFGYPLAVEQEAAQNILDNFFGDIPHQFYNVERKTVTEGIYDFQKEHEIDLVAMISNKHSFFENLLFRPVINEIGFRIKTPFLVIPSGKFNT